MVAPKKAAAAKKSAAKKTPASTASAKGSSGAKKRSTPKKAAALRVRSDEAPWTSAELEAVNAELLEQRDHLQAELAGIESDIQQLMSDSGEGSGDDDVDTGAKTSERQQELTVALNSRAMLEQNERALQAIEEGTYGVCESCGKPIGKLRLQAQPRATLCVTCKQEQERH
ncbi:TraR/DksA family transcriptional regulator [Demetria terragena]|uniref:TraR/DksA family transcriptional regulator n=1 Tax=Demetria terragena TaxID=63959 RepID=UPI00037E77C7|nr:TraR/DksA family transcriptional regulator [Demetria terragena]